MVDDEYRRVLYGLLQDQLQIVFHKQVDNAEVLAESLQDRPHNRLQQKLVLRQPQDALLKHKRDLEELNDFANGEQAVLLHLLELVFWVDCFQVEAVGQVALHEVVVVSDSVYEDDAFLGAVLGEGGNRAGEGEAGIALANVVDEQQRGQQFVRLGEAGDALAEADEVELLVVDMQSVELHYLIVYCVLGEFSLQDELGAVVHVDVVDKVHYPLHFSTGNNFIILFLGSLDLGDCGNNFNAIKLIENE